jgi:hypothetical protein
LELEEKIIKLLSNENLRTELENNITKYLATKTFAKHFSDLTNEYKVLLGRNS